MSPDDRAWIEALLASAASSSETEWRREVQFSAGPRTFPADLMLVAHRAPEGPIAYFSVVLADLTERKLLERSLLQGQKLEGLSTVAAGIAHEFNNLLAVVRGNAYVLGETAAGGDLPRAALADIEQATVRASELTRELLTFSGEGAARLAPADLRGVLAETKSVLAVLDRETPATFEGTDEALPLLADAPELHRAIAALTTNAREAAGPNGRVTIRTGSAQASRAYLSACQLGAAAAAGPYVFVEVSDNGPGIAADVLPRIFDPFFSTRFAGRGLGLAAVLGIVRSHAGVIHVETSATEGTTVRLLFPRLKEPGANRAA